MNKLRSVTAFAPSTVANLSVGFDLLGMSVPVIGDRVKITKIDKKNIIIKSIIGDDGKLSSDIDKNTAGKPIKSMLRDAPVAWGVEIEIIKGIPLSSGLGGSASSAVAAVMAMNRLLGDQFSNKQLIEYALDGEEIASGARHVDNVAPALYGGLVACLNTGKIYPLKMPKNIFCMLIYPDIEINTKDARDILNKEISHDNWIQQSSSLLGFMTGIANGDREIIFDHLEDIIVTPQRKHLIPPFDSIAKIVKKNNGTELGISGAGPTMFSFFYTKEDAENTAIHFKEYVTYISEVPGAGAFVEQEI
jgi:homoserine kinase